MNQKIDKFAVKIFNFDFYNQTEDNRTKIMKFILNESKVLEKLDHENIVKCFFYCPNEENFYQFMELCNLGTLKNYLEKKRSENSILPESEIKNIVLDILKGMQYIYYYFFTGPCSTGHL